jgi:hypothetical protein
VFGPAPKFRRWRFLNAERFAARRPATSDGGPAEPGAKLSAMFRSVSVGVHGAVLGDSSKDMSGLGT